MNVLTGICLSFAALLTAGAGLVADPHSLRETREFAAPPDAVWDAWHDPELIRQWWGPTGFVAPVVEVDFTEGGTTLVCMQAPDMPLMCNTWTYTHIAAQREIVFEPRFADENGKMLDPAELGLPLGIPAITPHRITFSETANGGTLMTIEETGYGTAEAANLSHQGLLQVLDKFAGVVE